MLAPAQRFLPAGTTWSREQLEALPGLSLHDLMQLSIERLRRFFEGVELPSALLDEALKLLLDEIRTRLKYLCDVGLGYLTLDRQSRTLSGGEVQRINLTTALGTSLVNTMFVLDEPSIGLHPRDMGRIVQAMHRLRDAGNTLVVDTTNFTEKTQYEGSSDKLHVVERFSRIDDKTLLYRFTIEDPDTWVQPWMGEYTWPATDDLLYEYACHEANYAMGNILRGARERERDAKPGSAR